MLRWTYEISYLVGCFLLPGLMTMSNPSNSPQCLFGHQTDRWRRCQTAESINKDERKYQKYQFIFRSFQKKSNNDDFLFTINCKCLIQVVCNHLPQGVPFNTERIALFFVRFWKTAINQSLKQQLVWVMRKSEWRLGGHPWRHFLFADLRRLEWLKSTN